jgi:ankyrin repeat protein
LNEALAEAGWKGCLKIIDWLVRNTNADVNYEDRDRFGNTALHHVIWNSEVSITPLHWACGRGDLAAVKKLALETSFEINIQDNFGYTPLHVACMLGKGKGHYDVVEWLMLAGASEIITDQSGETPADVAKQEAPKLLELLDRQSLFEVLIRRKGKMRKLRKSVLIICATTKMLQRLQSIESNSEDNIL